MSHQPMIIAIDGPAGAGKSTVTRRVAERLGILYLDTGAMYRAATLAVLEAGLEDPAAIAARVTGLHIDFDAQGQVRLDGRVLGEAIRSPEVTAAVWRVADQPQCRAHLVAIQQVIIADRDAALKIYLDASAEQRARRRLQEWPGDQPPPDLDTVAAAIAERDARDRARPVGDLQVADDAVVIATDDLAIDEVVARILALAVERRPLLLEQVVADQVIVGRSRQAGYIRVAEGSINDPPRPWQLGLTNPSPDRLPHSTTSLARNRGGRQAGVLLQGRAVLVLAGSGDRPGLPTALPILPQSWYVIEAGVWHAIIQIPGTVCAWAEACDIAEEHEDLDQVQRQVMWQYLAVYLRDDL